MKSSESEIFLTAQIREAVARIAKRNNLDLVYLFGSKATGTANQMSDLDVAVRFSKAVTREDASNRRSHLIVEFMRVFATDRVDLIVLNTAPFALAFSVVKEGMILFASNEDARENFEIHAIRDYLDFKPFEEVYFREMSSQIHQGGEETH